MFYGPWYLTTKSCRKRLEYSRCRGLGCTALEAYLGMGLELHLAALIVGVGAVKHLLVHVGCLALHLHASRDWGSACRSYMDNHDPVHRKFQNYLTPFKVSAPKIQHNCSSQNAMTAEKFAPKIQPPCLYPDRSAKDCAKRVIILQQRSKHLFC